jgi:hypothetical protein
MSAPDPFATLVSLPDVYEATEAARAAVDAALRHERLRRRHDPRVTAEALAQAASASAELEGWAQPPLKLLASTSELAAVVRTAPLQAIARMHVLAAAGAEGTGTLGQPRPGADVSRLTALAQQLVQPTQAPALVVAAVAHAEVLAVAPFDSANGLVARQLARTLMAARGLDPHSVTVPEAGHLDASAEYRAALAEYTVGTPEGVRRWLIHCADALRVGARRTRDICDALD